MLCLVPGLLPFPRNMELPERAQQWVSKMLKRLEHFSCEEMLRESWDGSVWRRLRGTLSIYKYLKGMCKEDGASPLSAVPSDRRGTGCRLKHRRFLLDMKKHFFSSVSVTEPWDRSPREIVEFTILAEIVTQIVFFICLLP